MGLLNLSLLVLLVHTTALEWTVSKDTLSTVMTGCHLSGPYGTCLYEASGDNAEFMLVINHDARLTVIPQQLASFTGGLSIASKETQTSAAFSNTKKYGLLDFDTNHCLTTSARADIPAPTVASSKINGASKAASSVCLATAALAGLTATANGGLNSPGVATLAALSVVGCGSLQVGASSTCPSGKLTVTYGVGLFLESRQDVEGKTILVFTKPPEQHEATAKVWHGVQGTVSSYSWPELESKYDVTADTQNVAVTMSGGGYRSYSAGFGQLRALHDLGLLSKARYTVALSGSAWLTSIFTYQQTGRSDSQMLEPVTEDPSALTIEKLEQLPETSIAYGATKDFFPSLLKGITFNRVPGEVWHDATVEALYSHYNLHDDKYFTYNQASKDEILAANTFIKSEDIILPAAGKKPFLIMPHSIMGPFSPGELEGKTPILDKDDKEFGMQESTPLYTGSYLRQSMEVAYADNSKFTRNTGGYIESFAYGGVSPGGDAVSSGNSMQMQLPRKKWTIERAAGSTSVWGSSDIFYIEDPEDPDKRVCDDSWYNYDFCTVTTGSSTSDLLTSMFGIPMVGPVSYAWDTANPSDTSMAEKHVRLSDGASEGDYSGLVNAIVRGVSTIPLFINTNMPLCNADVWDPTTNTTIAKITECVDSWLAVIFGYPISEGPAWGISEQSTERLQLFEKSQFIPLVKALQANQAAGNGAVARVKLTTVDHPYEGVPAGREITVVVFLLSDSHVFRESLPADTKAELAKGDEGKLARFPHYSTMGQNAIGRLAGDHEDGFITTSLLDLTPEQINLLSQLTSWMVVRNKDLLMNAAGEWRMD